MRGLGLLEPWDSRFCSARVMDLLYVRLVMCLCIELALPIIREKAESHMRFFLLMAKESWCDFGVNEIQTWDFRFITLIISAGTSGRAVLGLGLRPLACWDCGLRVRTGQGHGCLSLVSVVCYQVEASTSGWSFLQRIPTQCGVSECDR
jgi:hypothetical protein